MMVKKRKVRKSLFYVLSKHLRKKVKKCQQKKAWPKGFFRERKNKNTYHQTLENKRVLDREDHFRCMVTYHLYNKSS